MSITPLATATRPFVSLQTISTAAPFQELPDVVLKAIADISDFRAYDASETIVSIGQYDASEFFVIIKGMLKAAWLNPQTGAMTIEAVKLGEVFGLAAAVSALEAVSTDTLTLTAEEETEVLAVDAEGFRQIVAQRPTLTRSLMLHFATQIAKGGLSPIAPAASPEQRVYAALLELTERDASIGMWRIARMPKHRELADSADVDETVAAHAVAQLIQDGVARRDYPGLIIEDMEKMKLIAL